MDYSLSGPKQSSPMARCIEHIVGSAAFEATCLDSNAASAVRQLLVNRGFHIINIDLQGLITSRDLFFHIMAELPCDPEYGGLHDNFNGDAVADSLSGGLSGEPLQIADVAIVFRNAENLMTNHLNLFLSLYETIIWIVRGRNITKNKGKMKLFAFGIGANFAPVAGTEAPISP